MLGRLINLPFKVIGTVARAVQERNDAAMKAQHGEGEAGDSYDYLAERELADREVPADYDPGKVDISASAALTAFRGEDRPFFVDVSAVDAYGRGHIPGAVHMPGGSIEIRLAELPPDRRVIVSCQDGVFSRRVVRFLRFRGLEDTWVLTGGLPTWKKAGGPLE